MSLEFAGYSATVQHQGKTIGRGHSPRGPNCCPTEAVQHALACKTAKDVFAKVGEDWETTIDLRVIISLETSMPSGF